MKQVLLLFLVVSSIACNKSTPGFEGVYFGGEIVNPTSEYVVLYRNEHIVDSAKLDNNNRFEFRLDSVDAGLHHFNHEPELQYVFLEQNDSIRVHLNTIDFDESLMFTGDNAALNNFLIEMFLDHEMEEHLIKGLYKLPPQKFLSKIDSIRKPKITLLKDLSEENSFTEAQVKMAKASIDYNYFIYKEKYPYYHKKKTGVTTLHKLDDSFFEHHKKLNANEEDLVYFRPYYDFLKYYFGNLSYTTCLKECKDECGVANNYLHINKHKIKLIDSIVEVPKLHDNLLRNVVVDYLLKVHEANKNCDSFIKSYKKISKNPEHIAEIENLYEGIKSLQPQKEVPHILVQDINGDLVSTKSISKSNHVVYYFWTSVQKEHFKKTLKLVEELEEQNPNYNFVGINMLTSESQWHAMLKEANLDGTKQFRAVEDYAVKRGFIVDHMNKCVITEDTLIVDAFGHLYASFEPKRKRLKH